MNTDLAQRDSTIPDWVKQASTGASFGNMDQSDLGPPPRLKVLAGQSPEVTDGVSGAVPGNFWLTVLNQNLGKEVIGVPITFRKTYQLWAPKEMGVKGPLASASDGVNWDEPNQTFEVRYMDGATYHWDIKRTVAESGLGEFGSSRPDNSSSKPAAILTYDILWLIDLPNGQKQLCIFTNTRTGIVATRNFLTVSANWAAQGVDRHFQRYKIGVKKKTGPTGDPYFTYEFQHIGNFGDTPEDRELGKYTYGLYQQYSKSGFVPADRAEDEGAREKVDDSIPF